MAKEGILTYVLGLVIGVSAVSATAVTLFGTNWTAAGAPSFMNAVFPLALAGGLLYKLFGTK